MNKLIKTLPTTLTPHDMKKDLIHRESASGWVYTPESKALYVLAYSPSTLMITVKDSKHGDFYEVHRDSVSSIPCDKDFEKFKSELSIFECFDKDGRFNMDTKFHNMASQVIDSDSIQDLENAFSLCTLFITNSICSHIEYDKDNKNFFVVSLSDTFYCDSFDLAIKDSYEFNKELPETV